MNEIVNKFLLAGDKFMPEMCLKQPGFTYSFTYSQSLHGYMCKICEIYYSSSPCPTNLNRGAWSLTPVTLHDNAGKKLQCQNSWESHKQAILGLANLRIEDTIGSRAKGAKEKSQGRHEANNLYIWKLICTDHFLAWKNLPVKSIYQKFIEFLSHELEEPIIKQYLGNCSKNATYTSQKTCDSLIASLEENKRKNEKICWYCSFCWRID